MSFPKELGLPSHYVAKLVRCVYGTRDAGAIWEDCYRDALEAMGFTSGIASPCCFYHAARGISVVVHGDDFTNLGTDEDLDWLQVELAKYFEIKVRGGIGEAIEGDNDMRILNRIVTVEQDKITYEADPRHVDLMSASLGITAANSVVTPGLKDSDPDYDLVKTNEPDMPATLNAESMTSNLDIEATPEPIEKFIQEPVAIINSCLRTTGKKGTRKVQVTGPLHEKTTFHEVTPYSEIYGHHPRQLISTSDGFKLLSSRADPFTGKLGAIVH